MYDWKNEFHGGKREGAGRKALGITRKISITLTQDQWDFIDSCVKPATEISSRSAYFRFLHVDRFEPQGIKTHNEFGRLLRRE